MIRIRKYLISLIAAILVLIIAFGVYYFYPSQYIAAVNKQADWISSLQTPNGAIIDSKSPSSYQPLQYKVTPYFANIAATAITYRKGKHEIVKKYIQWYLEHLNWPDTEELYLVTNPYFE